MEHDDSREGRKRERPEEKRGERREEERRDGGVSRRRRSPFPDRRPVRRRSSTISIECGGIRMKAGRKRGFT